MQIHSHHHYHARNPPPGESYQTHMIVRRHPQALVDIPDTQQVSFFSSSFEDEDGEDDVLDRFVLGPNGQGTIVQAVVEHPPDDKPDDVSTSARVSTSNPVTVVASSTSATPSSIVLVETSTVLSSSSTQVSSSSPILTMTQSTKTTTASSSSSTSVISPPTSSHSPILLSSTAPPPASLLLVTPTSITEPPPQSSSPTSASFPSSSSSTPPSSSSSSVHFTHTTPFYLGLTLTGIILTSLLAALLAWYLRTRRRSSRYPWGRPVSPVLHTFDDNTFAFKPADFEKDLPFDGWHPTHTLAGSEGIRRPNQVYPSSFSTPFYASEKTGEGFPVSPYNARPRFLALEGTGGLDVPWSVPPTPTPQQQQHRHSLPSVPPVAYHAPGGSLPNIITSELPPQPFVPSESQTIPGSASTISRLRASWVPTTPIIVVPVPSSPLPSHVEGEGQEDTWSASIRTNLLQAFNAVTARNLNTTTTTMTEGEDGLSPAPKRRASVLRAQVPVDGGSIGGDNDPFASPYDGNADEEDRGQGQEQDQEERFAGGVKRHEAGLFFQPQPSPVLPPLPPTPLVASGEFGERFLGDELNGPGSERGGGEGKEVDEMLSRASTVSMDAEEATAGRIMRERRRGFIPL